MKKTTFSLIAAGVAGFLAIASAQPLPGDDNATAPVLIEGQPGGNGPDDPGGQPELPGESNPLPDMAGGLDSTNEPAMPLTENAADNNGGETPNENQESAVITPSHDSRGSRRQIESNFLPPEKGTGDVNDLTLHYTRAPLDMVLNYLSDAAGFIIVQEARINQNVTVTVNGKHLTRNEAVDLLNTVLNQNGYAAIRDGRTLTIVDKNDAKTRGIPVKTGNDPEAIPRNAEIVTQIIPIRFVEAQQLVSDLQSFVSPQATVVANQAGNSIVITDTQANIKHLTEIIKAIDDSAQAETEIRVFRLRYANPNDVATELANVFPSSTSGSGSQSPIRFGGGVGGFGRFGGFGNFGGGGGGFGRGGGGGGGGAAGANSTSDRIRKATQVAAVADTRIQAVIVTAPKDLMEEIANMMKDLDVPSDRDQNVYVFHLDNGDPQQTAQVLQSMFQSTQSRNANNSSQNSALQQRAQNAATTTSSQNTSTFGSPGGSGGGRGGNQF